MKLITIKEDLVNHTKEEVPSGTVAAAKEIVYPAVKWEGEDMHMIQGMNDGTWYVYLTQQQLITILEANRTTIESRLTEIERVLNIHPISITKKVNL